jgi:PAS domain S-box-containing protein
MAGENQTADLEAELARLRARVLELESKVADRRRKRKLLQDQLRFLQTLIDTIPNPIFYKNTKGFYLGCNKAFAMRLGLDGKEIVGKRSSDFFPRELAAKYAQHDAELLARPGETTYETKLVYPDGQEHDVIITKGIFTDSDGNVAGLVGVILDITERKRAEDALKEAHDLLERRVENRTASLAQANRNLEREIAERSRIAEELRVSSEKLKLFAYSVAHDLKSPSIGIYGLARLLQKNFAADLSDKGMIICAQILRASEHVASLVDAINVFISTKETPLKIEQLDMAEVLHALCDEFSARLRLRRVSLTGPEKAPVVNADKISMLRVFRNLIDNSMKYGGDRLTSIKIRYECDSDWHHFTVIDDGVGIQVEKTGKVFDWFQRQSTSEGIEGSGLGLAIIKEIVELHKGDVRLEPGSEGGTVFHIRIARNL